MYFERKIYNILGLMSGTSLDGLDLAACSFSPEGFGWSYQIHSAETVPYTEQWTRRILEVYQSDAASLARLHMDLGAYMGRLAKEFLFKTGFAADFIASHGHTLFHNPAEGYTFQAGNGAALSAESGIPVITDFRSGDVARGGQGAPLVPLGDACLFAEYDACLNIGGFANISYNDGNRRIAYDIAPANMALNELANRMGKPFDDEGAMAKSGKIDPQLLHDLLSLPYFHQPPPKSLGREGYEAFFRPVILQSRISIHDSLCTLNEMIALLVAASLPDTLSGKGLLITGGGGRNRFLVERIRHHCHCPVEVPDTKLIDFKEALIFAFLGLKYVLGETNTLASVTGAKKDSVTGALYFP